jgi:hypothetical protein
MNRPNPPARRQDRRRLLGGATAASATRHLGIHTAINLIVVLGYALVLDVSTIG